MGTFKSFMIFISHQQLKYLDKKTEILNIKSIPDNSV